MIQGHNLKQKYQRGFTIVELLIVIVIIGILAALVLNSFSGVQAKARDSERTTDVRALSSQLEAYYSGTGNGAYPSQNTFLGNGTVTISQANAETWAAANLKGMDINALRAPSLATGIAAGTTSAASYNKDVYYYSPLQSGGTLCVLVTDVCTKYVIYYGQEATSTEITKNSLN